MTRRAHQTLALVMYGNPVSHTSGGEPQFRGELLTFDVPPQLKDGNVLLPIRRISESLGAAIEWDEATRTVTIYHNGEEILLQIGSNVFHRDDEKFILDVPAELISNRVFVPLQVFVEGLGVSANWDDVRQAVWIWSSAELNVT